MRQPCLRLRKITRREMRVFPERGGGKIGAGPPLVSRHFVNRCIQTILFALKIRFAIWKIFHNFVYADDFNK